MNRLGRSWMFALACALAACGGGGGDDGGDDAPISVVVGDTVVDVTTVPTDVGPTHMIPISMSQRPTQPIHVFGEFTNSGVQAIQYMSYGMSTGAMYVGFRPGASVGDGVYNDTVTIKVCKDAQCREQYAGSPAVVQTSMTVHSTLVASLDKTQLNIEVPGTHGTEVVESIRLSLSGAVKYGSLTVRPQQVGTGFLSIDSRKVTDREMRLDFHYGFPSQQAWGVYRHAVTLDVCYDAQCQRPVTGSPFVVDSSYEVVNVPPADTGFADLPVTASRGLAHNVIDAEYSRSLDAIVMVSSWPENALVIHDGPTGTQRRVALSKPPTSVSIGPDGRQAVVGHDALLTQVDLDTLATRTVNAGLRVGDLVLDGRGKVYAFTPMYSASIDLYTIDLASGAQSTRQGTWPGTQGRLHPSGDRLYAASNGLQPDDIENYDISTGAVTAVRDSIYHGEHPFCGNLWFSEDGATIYTACARTFSASATASLDMVYQGTLPLTDSMLYGPKFRSLSQRSALNEIVAVEDSGNDCEEHSGSQVSCRSRLGFYKSDNLGLTARYAINPVQVGPRLYDQRGLFVFHRNDGRKLVVTRLMAMYDPASEYYVRLVQ